MELVGEQDMILQTPCVYKEENHPSNLCLNGTLECTNYRVRFSPDWSSVERNDGVSSRNLLSEEEYFEFPLGYISKLDGLKDNRIKINTTDGRKFVFAFESPVHQAHVLEMLDRLAFPKHCDLLFAFIHRSNSSGNGFNIQQEWHRQRLDPVQWRQTTINEEYKAIDTYPSCLVVPTTIHDQTLLEAAKFRSLGRIPVLTWLHPTNTAALCRCSQPKIGIGSAVSVADQMLVTAIGSANANRQHVHIIDCRPFSSAHANRAKGYGTENMTNYPSCSLDFMNIENIHTIRESRKKLLKLSHSKSIDNTMWWGNVEETKWLYHIRVVLKAALHVANVLEVKGESVLVHCSHGWDRTSQIAAIAQLFVDPYYRTIDGFRVLIEKDWRSFGHPFQLRHVHCRPTDTQIAPIFLQFIDCVYQIVRQYPTAFEFTTSALLFVTREINSCRSGSFLMDTGEQRRSIQLDERTLSIWELIMSEQRDTIVNENYIEQRLVLPECSRLLRNVVLWNQVHMRWSAQYS